MSRDNKHKRHDQHNQHGGNINSQRNRRQQHHGGHGNSHRRGNLLPFDVIETAAMGDVEAINAVLKHYEGYIIALSTKRLYDEQGNPYMVVDTEMRRTLETRLIVKIMQFDVNRAA